MKLRIQSPDASNRIDGVIQSQIINHLPVGTDGDAVLVPISWLEDFRFNPILNTIRKPIIILEMMEYGSAWDGKETHIFGKNPEIARNLQSEEWRKLDEWAKNHPANLYFKRELLRSETCSTIKPIEFLCYLEHHPLQSQEEFNARPLEVSFIWGFSHSSRPRLHGDIFKGMATHGLGVISDWDQFHPHFSHNPPARNWATVHVPWYARHPIADCLWMNERSKIGVSCYGNGRKSFRSSELRSTVMAMPEDDLEWTYPWIHGQNCLKFETGREFEMLEEFTKRDDLYDIYVAGDANLDKYRIYNYINNYFIPSIQAAL